MTRKELKKVGVIFLKKSYLKPKEQQIFTRIDGKSIRSWDMTIEKFLAHHKGNQIYIYPKNKTSIVWKVGGKFYIRGYSIAKEE